VKINAAAQTRGIVVHGMSLSRHEALGNRFLHWRIIGVRVIPPSFRLG
jgi:hypothetical protein